MVILGISLHICLFTSVLGSLLCLIYINHLQKNSNLRVLNFADDTLLYKTVNKNTYKQDNTDLNVQLKKFQIGK